MNANNNLAPTSVASDATKSTTSIENSPKQSKGPIVIAIITSIVAVIGIVAGIYFFMDANHKSIINSDLSAKLDLIKRETNAELIEKEENGTTITVVTSDAMDETSVKNIAIALRDMLNETFDTSSFFGTFGERAIVEIPDTGVYTSSTNSYGVDIDFSDYTNPLAQDIMDRSYDAMMGYLISVGFVDTTYHSPFPAGGKIMANYDEGVYCTINEPQQWFYARCAKDSWYDTSNKELMVALSETLDEKYFFIKADANDIIDSPVSPYQTINANGGTFALVFYRTSPDSDWQFFTGAQSVLSCSDYDTQDLRNAFADQVCYDEANGQISTVQP